MTNRYLQQLVAERDALLDEYRVGLITNATNTMIGDRCPDCGEFGHNPYADEHRDGEQGNKSSGAPNGKHLYSHPNYDPALLPTVEKIYESLALRKQWTTSIFKGRFADYPHVEFRYKFVRRGGEFDEIQFGHQSFAGTNLVSVIFMFLTELERQKPHMVAAAERRRDEQLKKLFSGEVADSH